MAATNVPRSGRSRRIVSPRTCASYTTSGRVVERGRCRAGHGVATANACAATVDGWRSLSGTHPVAFVLGTEPHRGRLRIDQDTAGVEPALRVTGRPDPVPGAVGHRPPPLRPDRRERTVDAVDDHPHLLRIGRVDADVRHPLIMAAEARPCI